MNPMLAKLLAAKNKMPASMPAAEAADIILTLLFWRLMSDWVSGKAIRFHHCHQNPSAEITRIRQANHIAFNDATLYSACQWIKPESACLVVRKSLLAWAKLQSGPILHGLLRPERLGKSSPYYAEFSQSSQFAEVVQLIGGMSFAPIPIGQSFSQAVDILHDRADALPIDTVQLVVDLLDLLPIDRIYDPACGDGQLLLACSNDMARRVPSHQLHLHGNVADAGQAALAGMHMLAHGLRLFVLEQTDALGAPLVHKVPELSAVTLPCADVLLTRLPDAPQDWGVAAAATDTRRFPLGPPKDSRIALIWHGLAHLKDDKSRMGVILSLTVLDSAEGLALRRYLVQHYHLEAVIELPGTRRSGSALSLLLLRRENSPRTVAFIAGKQAIANQVPALKQKGQYDAAYDVDKVLRAYHTYLASSGMQYAPFLHLIDYDTLAKHDCQFYLASYDRWLCGERPPAMQHG